MLWPGVIALVYVLLVGVGIVGDGFKWISGGVDGAEQIFAFATNPIGTTVTALLAATAVTGDYEVFALQIALVHLFYNLFGVLLFAGIPVLWRMPARSARWLGNMTEKSRLYAFAYIFLVFFVLPGGILSVQAVLGNNDPTVIEAEADETKLDAAENDVEKTEFAIE